MVKYFEYREANGDTEETWLFYTAADQATDTVFLSLVEYRRTTPASGDMRSVDAYWCEDGPIASTMIRADVPPMRRGDIATNAMHEDAFARMAAGVS